MIQFHPQLVNFLSLPIELTPTEKNYLLWNKAQNILGAQSLETLYQTKMK